MGGMWAVQTNHSLSKIYDQEFWIISILIVTVSSTNHGVKAEVSLKRLCWVSRCPNTLVALSLQKNSCCCLKTFSYLLIVCCNWQNLHFVVFCFRYLKKMPCVRTITRLWEFFFFFLLFVSPSHSHWAVHCSTHWSSDTHWESWISLLPITSQNSAIPDRLISGAPSSPMWRRRQAHTDPQDTRNAERHHSVPAGKLEHH